MAEPGTELAAQDAPPEKVAARDIHYEVAIDEAPSGLVTPVDPAAPVAELRPIVPKHLQTLAGARLAAGVWAGRQWHRARFHGIRAPHYLLASLLWAVVGLLRLAGRQIHWWWHMEQHDLRSQTVIAGDTREYMKLQKEAKETRAFRGGILAGELVAIAAAGVALWLYAPWWLDAAAAAVTVAMLAKHGHPADKPILRPAVVTPRFRKLSADIVLRAYYAAGLGHPDKPGQQVTFGSTMSRDGEGTRVLVDLPYGKGLRDAVGAKESIASGLDVTDSQVFLHRDPSSQRRHTLWVADRDPLAVPVGRTPLLACRATDIWKPAPLGLDERGQLVTVPMVWNSMLISALPRAGKTFSARLLALYCALDPFVKLSVFDAKGSPDWRKFALVADSFAFGLTPTKHGLPGDILVETLQAIKADVQDRYHRLSEMPVEICPEGKLTRAIARDPRYHMPIRVLIMEEFQEYFDMGEASKEIASLLVFLVKVAPGAGVILLDATQRPSGVGSGQVAQQFTSFRDNHALRFGLRTSSWQVSELCLGAGAYSEGLDTSTLLPQYKGVGILRGATDASPTVRTYLADGQDAEKILTAARALREKAGTLTGMAAGEADPAGARDVLADVLAVFASDAGLHWTILAERLARQFPDRWADATGDAVSAQCRDLGVASVVVKAQGVSLRGCRLADIQQAAGR